MPGPTKGPAVGQLPAYPGWLLAKGAVGLGVHRANSLEQHRILNRPPGLTATSARLP